MKSYLLSAITATAVTILLALSVCPKTGTSEFQEARLMSQSSTRAGVTEFMSIENRIAMSSTKKYLEDQKTQKVAATQPDQMKETSLVQEKQETDSQSQSQKDISVGYQKTTNPGETWIDQDIVDICNVIGNQRGISPELLEAMIEKESSGKQYVSNGVCVGLMQVNWKLHGARMQHLGYTDIYDKEANIATGADLLLELCNKYGDIGVALMAYNGTPNAATRGYLTTYAQSILNRAAELERIHGK